MARILFMKSHELRQEIRKSPFGGMNLFKAVLNEVIILKTRISCLSS